MSLIDRNVVIISKTAKPTSIASANAIYGRTGSIRRQVWEFILRQGMRGATDNEMQTTLHMSGDTQRPTRTTLQQDGLIMDTGETRRNARGRECIVYRATDADWTLL